MTLSLMKSLLCRYLGDLVHSSQLSACRKQPGEGPESTIPFSQSFHWRRLPLGR
jgi:hypothetical protein